MNEQITGSYRFNRQTQDWEPRWVEGDEIILGQEAVCPDGLGRVIAYSTTMPDRYIQVSTYVNDRGCKWAPENVELIDPRRAI